MLHVTYIKNNFSWKVIVNSQEDTEFYAVTLFFLKMENVPVGMSVIQSQLQHLRWQEFHHTLGQKQPYNVEIHTCLNFVVVLLNASTSTMHMKAFWNVCSTPTRHNEYTESQVHPEFKRN